AVREFQSYYGLKENGIADARTLEKLDDLLDTPFKDGESDERTIQLKADLVVLGFGSFTYHNENYGPITESAVREFQTFYGLNENGIAEERTLEKIDDLLNTPMKRGDYRKDA